MEIQTITFQSPIGYLKITGTEKAIKAVCFTDEPLNISDNSDLVFPVLEECKKQLCEYFTGQRNTFTIQLEPDGTDFQKSVWHLLAEIPFGRTLSYGDLAQKLGDKNLMRAVGGANGKNPIAIILPCHRVIGTNGTLTGYAGGMWRKKWLLDLEQPEKQTLLF